MSIPMSIASSFDSLPKHSQFLFLTLGLFFFFGAHNLLQEAVMRRPAFHYGIMLGYFEVLGVTIMSKGEMVWFKGQAGGGGKGKGSSKGGNIEANPNPNPSASRAPLRAYLFVAGCLMASSSLSNLALNYINYPTKVVFRSCKLLPTMALATLINGRAFRGAEYAAAAAVCAGLVLFARADWEHGGPDFNPVGMLLVILR